MTVHNTEYTLTARERVAAFFSRIGRIFEDAMEMHSRRDQIEALYAKSDEELAKLGITRHQIPQYVFRDRAWL